MLDCTRQLRPRAGFPGTPEFTMAFQPVVELDSGRILAYEALARPVPDGAAGSLFEQIPASHRCVFDQYCRIKAVKLAAGLDLRAPLAINVLPVGPCPAADCLDEFVVTADRYGFSPERLILELPAPTSAQDLSYLAPMALAARRQGMLVALDDFHATSASTPGLVELRPNLVKLAMSLVRRIDADAARRAQVRAILGHCARFGAAVIAKGVETFEEAATLGALEVSQFQGYLFARPAIERLAGVPEVVLERVRSLVAEQAMLRRDARRARAQNTA
ncbi:MAG: EAL domain-containing protein [Gammaproteobacteria bacterium]|nr:EAL domain-containing protein [Gammaproteobacteria bacterium]